MRNIKLVTTISFLLACLLFIPVLIQCLPGHPWEEGTNQHTVIRTLWFFCSIAILVFICRQGQIKENIAGTILLIIFGPISILSLIFIGIYYKVIM